MTTQNSSIDHACHSGYYVLPLLAHYLEARPLISEKMFLEEYFGIYWQYIGKYHLIFMAARQKINPAGYLLKQPNN